LMTITRSLYTVTGWWPSHGLVIQWLIYTVTGLYSDWLMTITRSGYLCLFPAVIVHVQQYYSFSVNTPMIVNTQENRLAGIKCRNKCTLINYGWDSGTTQWLERWGGSFIKWEGNPIRSCSSCTGRLATHILTQKHWRGNCTANLS